MASVSNDRRARLAKKQERDMKEESGGGYRVLDTSEYPDITWVKPELETDYLFDIIPYVVTSKKHPKYATLKDADPDFMEDDRLDLYVHTKVGPSKKNMVCPKKNYDKDCPICEEHDRLKEDEDLEWNDEKLYALRPKRKSFYNVVDLEDNNKMKIFEYSYGWFTRNLKDQIKRKSKKRQYLLGDISEDGFSIGFEFSKSKYNGKEYCGEVKSFDFEDMENQYNDEDIDTSPRLDTMIKISSYDEISNAFWGNDDDDDGSDKDGVDKEDKPSTSKRDRGDKKEEKEETSGRSSRRSEKTDSEDDTPSTRRRARRAKEEPSDPECPMELTFGQDIDTKTCVKDCEFYSLCDKKYEELHN
jgi:hypothetical protein